MEKETVEIYERSAEEWRKRRPAPLLPESTAFSTRVLPGRPGADLGCGPGKYLGTLGRPLIALDAAHAMLVLARDDAPDVPVVQGDLETLPFRRGALGGAWARNSYVHVPKLRMPLALARLHDAMAEGAPLYLTVIRGEREGEFPNDDFPGRFFALWTPDEMRSVVEGAGFSVDEVIEAGHRDRISIAATRGRTLPDFVAPDMQVLVCGLNPSLVAADAGFGYAGPTNRFWKAAVAAGLVSRPRDPWHTLTAERVGMTDLVKRATPRSSELTKDEYRAGAARVSRVVQWLRPRVVLFVGLEGWRAAVDPKAVAGFQSQPFGGVPAYVMPSTSGLNAHTLFDALVDHIRQAALVGPEG